MLPGDSGLGAVVKGDFLCAGGESGDRRTALLAGVRAADGDAGETGTPGERVLGATRRLAGDEIDDEEADLETGERKNDGSDGDAFVVVRSVGKCAVARGTGNRGGDQPPQRCCDGSGEMVARGAFGERESYCGTTELSDVGTRAGDNERSGANSAFARRMHKSVSTRSMNEIGGSALNAGESVLIAGANVHVCSSPW